MLSEKTFTRISGSHFQHVICLPCRCDESKAHNDFGRGTQVAAVLETTCRQQQVQCSLTWRVLATRNEMKG